MGFDIYGERKTKIFYPAFSYFLDFKFYEDPSDEYRDNSQGTLLPLWTFTFDKAKKLEITGLCWTPSYTDLFIASFGSCKFYQKANSKNIGYLLSTSCRFEIAII